MNKGRGRRKGGEVKAYVAALTENTDELQVDSGIRVRSSHCGCQITSTPRQEMGDSAFGKKGGRIINFHPLGCQ